MLIQLIGPGGAGKSTAGALLADQLSVPFVDLDERFMSTVGHIGEFIDSRGYLSYAGRNVALYMELLHAIPEPTILALSSGFMTYPEEVHESYPRHRDFIATSPTTFVLLPSLDFEACVAEIVRRQVSRAFIGQSAAHEEEVIRKRYWTYSAIPAMKIETMRAPTLVAGEIATVVARAFGSAPDRSISTEERRR